MFALRRNVRTLAGLLTNPTRSIVAQRPSLISRSLWPARSYYARDSRQIPETTRVYFGNLPYTATDAEIHAIVSQFEPKSCFPGRDNEGRFTGYCHLEFTSTEDAHRFMDAVYARQVDLGGRKLTAEFARSKYDQTSGRNPPTDTIYVGSLPYTATEADLRQVFEPFGPLVRISIAYSEDRASKGFAHVQFSRLEDAAKAVKEPLFIHDRRAKLDYAPPKRFRHNEPYHKAYFYDFTGDEIDLRESLKAFEKRVVRVYFLKNRRTDELSGSGFIDFMSVEDATDAIESLNGSRSPGGSPLNLTYARPPKTVSNKSSGNQGGNRYNSDW